VPIEVRPERRQTLGLRWLLVATDKRGEKYAREKLANELIEASNNTGAAVKKREDTHKMAEANRLLLITDTNNKTVLALPRQFCQI